MKWSLVGVAVVFVAVIALAVVVSRPGDDGFDETAVNNAESSVDLSEQAQTEGENTSVIQGTKLENFEPISGDVTELQTIDLVEGNGAEVFKASTITAHYTGAYASTGEIFQSSKDTGSPFTSPLNGLIQGWIEGLPGMREGGTRRLIIPGNLAYGEAPEGYTPGSTAQPLGPLVFDIELISVE